MVKSKSFARLIVWPASLACAIAQAQWVGDAETDVGAAAYLPLDETAGAIAQDIGPNKLKAQVAGRAQWVRGRFGNGLKFDGQSTTLDVAVTDMAAKAGAIQLWMQVAALGKAMCVWECAGKTGRIALRLTEAKRLAVVFSESGSKPVKCSADVSHWRPGQWRQVALLWELHERGGMKVLLQLYVDGRRVALVWGDAKAGIVVDRVRVGATLDGRDHFAGAVDEARVLKVSRKPMPWAEIAGPMLKEPKPPAAIEKAIAAKLRGAKPQARLDRIEGQLVLHNNRVAVALLDETQGMGVANVYHAARGVGFGAKPAAGYRGLIWRLGLRTDRGRGKRLALTNRVACERSAKLERTPGAAVLHLAWSNIEVDGGPDALDVEATIRLRDGSPRSEWRIHVDNRSKEWSLWEVYFPEIDLGQIGRSAEDDFLLIPRAEGRCMKSPIHGWSPGFMTGAGQPYGHAYPGGAHMQFAAYYESDGGYSYSSPRRAGLYLATEDGALNVKRFYYTTLAQANTIAYELRHYPPDMVTPGSDYAMPFDFVAAAYDGDWFDAARLYRRWATQQKWCRRGRFESRDDIPQWFKEADCMFRADSRRGTTGYFRTMCRDALKTLHPPVMCHWYNWMHGTAHAGHALLDYFPPKPGIAQAWAGAKEENIHIFPYVNAQIWGTASPSYAQAKPYTIKDEYGRVVNWSSPAYANMCRTQKWWRNVLVDACEKLVKQYQAGGLYLDQLGSAFNGLCLDPAHGHPLGGGSHAVDAARACFKEVRSRVGWQTPVLSEASSEENIDVSAGKIIHYNIWPGFVPAFAAVYHDDWSFYGRTAGGKPGDPVGFMNTGMIYIIGGQIGRIWPGRLPNALKGETKYGYGPQARFLKRLVDARHKGAKFLRYGEMLRPLELACKLPTVKTRRWRGNREMATPVVLPAVIASVWRAGDGEVGVVLANLTEQPVDFAGRFDPRDYGLPAQIKARPIVGEMATIEDEAGRKIIRARVPAYDTVIAGLSGRGANNE